MSGYLLIFADETAFIRHNYQNKKEVISRFFNPAKPFALKINLKNEVCKNPPTPGSHYIDSDVQIDVQVIIQVSKFRYLRFAFANNNRLDAELDTSTSNTSMTFLPVGKATQAKQRPLHGKVDCTAPYSLLYSAEIRTVYKANAQRLHVDIMRHFHKILNVM